MSTPLFQIDAFTSEAFSGNPAAVCFTDRQAPDDWMQNVAREMNLPETAFVRQLGDTFELRWFTPTTEVELCGHATLASAHALWETGRLAQGALGRFTTRSGILTAIQADDGWIELDFPAVPVEPVGQGHSELLAALGATPTYLGRSRFDYLVEVASEAHVRALQPDFPRLARASAPLRGVVVTSRADSDPWDFVSRFFAPASGIDEDPVTGSAHCSLGPYWRSRVGKARFLARQVSARGGVVRVEVAGDRVRLGGQAITILQGEIV